jgi:hypothetical protein
MRFRQTRPCNLPCRYRTDLCSYIHRFHIVVGPLGTRAHRFSNSAELFWVLKTVLVLRTIARFEHRSRNGIQRRRILFV